MDYFKIPGFIKLFNSNKILETRFKTINQIPIMTINRQQITLPTTHQKIAIVYFKDSKKCANIAEDIKNVKDCSVYFVPNQNSKEDYETILQNRPDSLGKMIINGPSMHPLFKFLIKGCTELYNHDSQFARKELKEDIGIFFYNGKKTEHFSQKEMKQFLSTVNK